MTLRPRPSACVSMSVVLFLLSGCSSNNFNNPTNATIGGLVKGGEQPITGSTIQLYAVNATTNGGASTPLITATVTTSDGTGNATNSNANAGNSFNALPAGYFTITGDYTCPSAGTQVYLTATGGNPGLIAGTNNATIQQMVALGACGQLSSSTNVVMNEVTTVGSIAALYPYMTAFNAIGSTAGNTSDLAEEFSVASEYMNPSSGVAPGLKLPTGLYASSNELDTLANILFTCINSTGATPGNGSTCGSLLLAAKPSSSSAPTNGVGLLLDILKNPTNNVSGIYGYISPTPAFYPYDLTAPTDFTLPILAIPTTPFTSPIAGTYSTAQSVTLTSQTSGATLYYTTNGITPTTASTVYSGPITISATQTVKTIAATTRAGSSPVGSYTYTLSSTPGTPVISLAPGTYSSPQIITVTSPTLDASIYVTTNGTTPTSSSTLLTSAMQLNQTETLKAIAIAGTQSSGVASAAYTYSPSSQTIDTLAGASTSGDNIAATLAGLNNPQGVAVDISGNLYIADFGNNRIRKVTAATGVISTVAGTGTAGYVSAQDGGPATSAQLSSPQGVSVDSSGNLYIADFGNNRIRKVTAATGVISTVAGTGTAGYVSSQDGGPATSAELKNPQAVAVDAAGNLYIADTANNRVRKITASTGVITTIAGGGTSPSTCSGSTDSNGDGCGATSAQFTNPTSVALDAGGNIYIDDQPTIYTSLFREVSASTGIVTIVAGGGTYAQNYYADDVYGDGYPATEAFFEPSSGVAADSSGNLYIADTGDYLLRKVTASTGIISLLAGAGFSPSVLTPTALAVDLSGNIYVADSANNEIRKYTASTGLLTTVAGNGTAGYALVQNGASATAAGLNQPFGSALDSSGNLYIADAGNNRIRKFTLATGFVTTLAGTATGGYSGDGLLATSAQLSAPHDIAVDSSGNLYIADYGNKRIRKITASTGIITTVAGGGTSPTTCSGSTDSVGDGCTATSAQISNPASVAVDTAGNLYIADQGISGQGNTSFIRKVSASTGIITIVAGGGLYSQNYYADDVYGDGYPATQAYMSGPSGVRVDASGNIYLSDTGDYLLRKVTVSTGIISLLAGVGFTPTTLTPAGIALDASGNVYVADPSNHVIRKFTASTSTLSTVAGIPATPGYTGDGGPASSAEVNGPNGVTIDAAGNLYIADTVNNSIRVINH